jgi:hypothetical protein
MQFQRAHDVARQLAPIVRIEIAAAFFATACSAAYDSADATGSKGEALRFTP